jgi:hypothetical protein
MSKLRIPMMSISRSEVMAISAERSDARLFQCESSDRHPSRLLMVFFAFDYLFFGR